MINVVVESEISTSLRARQVSAMFDVPAAQKCKLEWSIDFPIETESWQVGLIVGPSGSGKSTVMRHVFGEPTPLTWSAASVVDDFDATLSVQHITEACGAVGFNTIPAWLRPYAVLSNGERFRVEMARRLLEGSESAPIVVDEFTSVVDRQVAQISSHAVQKYVRKTAKRFVAVGCHYDVIDWLQPDWILDMATRSFTRRSLQRRPPLECVVGRVPYAAWRLFNPFHYMSSDLHRGARCFGLWVGETLAGFCGTLHMPHPKVDDVQRISRVVVLPDWQGVGVHQRLVDTLGSAYRGVGKRLRHYPSHPALTRALDRSPTWRLEKRPGQHSTRRSASSSAPAGNSRACAVFEYCGPAMPRAEAERLLAG